MTKPTSIEDFIISKIGGVLPPDREWMLKQLAKDVNEFYKELLKSKLPESYAESVVYGAGLKVSYPESKGYNACLADINKIMEAL